MGNPPVLQLCAVSIDGPQPLLHRYYTVGNHTLIREHSRHYGAIKPCRNSFQDIASERVRTGMEDSPDILLDFFSRLTTLPLKQAYRISNSLKMILLLPYRQPLFKI